MTSLPETAAAIPDGYVQDRRGRLVPLSMVKPAEQLEDDIVRRLVRRAQRVQRILSRFRGGSFDEVRAFQELLAETYGAKAGGQKGNLTLTSYDGLRKVTVAINDRLDFGPELHAAKSLVDECLTDWAKGGNEHLRVLVTAAFDVGKEGKLRVDRILELRRHAIDDERWKRAMEAISDAVRVESSRAYIRFHRRPNVDAVWEQITLDLANAA